MGARCELEIAPLWPSLEVIRNTIYVVSSRVKNEVDRYLVEVSITRAQIIGM